ncbi:MAG TPA: hypothetical protein VNS62_14160 [Candidatus Udaeobacter sp.]|nr:hypothetical protein [Candidatus Udaeobacter sp.]
MNHDIHPVKTNGHADYERRDIGIPAVYYFLVGLAASLLVASFAVSGLYHFLENRSQANQAPVSPLVANAPADTRRLPPEYTTDSEGNDYEKYLEKNFPAPQLETDERTELNKERLREENILSTYDYVDQNAGSLHIPIDRAMDLLAQRGLPTRTQGGETAAVTAKSQPQNTKGTKQ